jgi:hypothetical protein
MKSERIGRFLCDTLGEMIRENEFSPLEEVTWHFYMIGV